jgi:hypothetical protein
MTVDILQLTQKLVMRWYVHIYPANYITKYHIYIVRSSEFILVQLMKIHNLVINHS